jgi:hypothetical protein
MARMQDNPRRPPKQWMRHCVRGATASSRDPGAVCGSLWYHKMSAAQRRAALAREGKMQENQSGGLLVPLLIGGAILGGLILWANTSKGSTAQPSPPTRVPPASLPPAVKCVVSQAKLTQWGAGAGVYAFHTPMLGIEDPVSPSLAIDILPSEIRNQIDPLPSSAQIVLVDKNDVFHYFANDSTPSVRRDDMFADYCNKFGGTLAGHPSDWFMVA